MRQFDQTSLSHSQSKGALPIGKAPDILSGGDEGIRTLGPHVANVMLSQLSYIPTRYGAQRRAGKDYSAFPASGKGHCCCFMR